MAGRTSTDHRRLLDLSVSVLESTDGIPWPLVTDTFRAAVGVERAAIFFSRDWLERPPDDYPLPSDLRDATWTGFDEALAAHPLLAHLRGEHRPGPSVAGTDDLPRGRRVPADDSRHEVLTYFGTERLLAFALPAPAGSRQVMMMGLPGRSLRRREIEWCATAHPLLVAIARHERHLELLAAGGRRGSDRQARAREFRITPRELDVLELLAQARTAEAMARKLGISPRTVHHHLQSLYRKLGTSDRLATVLRAQHLGILTSPGDATR